ncbi:DNA-directed RNA polymerase [Aphelenchoides besseyi]|nr:DNA-directed RNA polymerase [Aphelenchoides besseyi]
MVVKILSEIWHSTNVTSNRVWCCAWKYDGRLLATSGEDRTVKVFVYDPSSGKLRRYTQIVGDQIRTIRCVSFSPCGSYLATASFDASALIYAPDDGTFEERHKLDGHENEVKSVCFSSSGQYLATSSRDKTVFIWQFDEDEDVEVDAVMQNHSGDVKFVTWHPNEDLLVSGGYDCSLIFYRNDGDDWISHQIYKEAHEDTIWSARFNSTGDYLVSVGGDSKMKLWKQCLGTTPNDTRWICVATVHVQNSKWPLYSVAWDPIRDIFAIGGGDRVLWIYELDRSSDTVNMIDSYRFPVDINCLAFNPKHTGVLAVALDNGAMDCDVAGYHVQSFNYMCDEGIQKAMRDVPPEKFRLASGDAVEFSYTRIHLGKPSIQSVKGNAPGSDATSIMPSECRQRGLTYRAPMTTTVDVRLNGAFFGSYSTVIGHVPIMLRSSRCHLENLSEDQLVTAGEERLERGGYFVCNGSEKVIRLLVGNKRNFPIALVRNASREKGKMFTEFSVMMRCIREGVSAAIINLHYLDSASMVITIQYKRELFYVPLMYIMKALTDLSDAQIFEHMIRLRPGDSFWASCVKNMLLAAAEEGVKDKQSALLLLGARFRVALREKVAPWEPDEVAAKYVLHNCICIHLDNDQDKFHCLTLMSQKLISLAMGEILPESPDNPQFQEATVSGHIFLLIIRERLENVLGFIRMKLEKIERQRGSNFHFDGKMFQQQLNNAGATEISRALEYFLATGNLATKNGLGLMQEQGFAVIAERINQLRFVSHFRAIHRGAFFMTTRTTDVRKLRPEAWGFICPVHTPDGAPCGLLNHVTASCEIVTHATMTEGMIPLLRNLRVITHEEMTLRMQSTHLPGQNIPTSPAYYPVILDGMFVGYVSRAEAPLLERQLRSLKVDPNNTIVPFSTELSLIRYSTDPKQILTQFPGLYIYTGLGRLIRPVRNLAVNRTEFIGIFEQVFLSVVIDPDEAERGVTMHQELHPCALFSFAGNLIPFPDHNQSPRNVYQCQMGKQTMGIPVHAWRNRADNKMYNLGNPQTPLLRLESHNRYRMDEYPLGTNACVAVISYTGYDMEDAMVINKSSFERGFAHGMVIKVERLELGNRGSFGRKEYTSYFCKDPSNELLRSVTDDGLPIPGRLYRQDDVYYCAKDKFLNQYKVGKYKSVEAAYCGIVRLVQIEEEGAVHALIQWRIPRNPIIGDKFASRHGQKGINSFLWPVESLPFAESGMVPDIIFNPHGFPSRMTIGMMIESMAGKSAALEGKFYDASPFVFNEENTAINHFGELLTKAGYNYYGNETMYSGVDGREMEVQIFFGIVYYQRLRHMIADKYQVRSTGAVDPVTLQPVKGRKKGGGVRFGEMERDTMIAHGSSFCLQDRLLFSSDVDYCKACARCSSIVSVTKLKPAIVKPPQKFSDEVMDKQVAHCLLCGGSSEVYDVQVPRVFRYLTSELSSMGIQLRCEIKDPKERGNRV